MISDFVKGKKRYDYPPGIQEGITLHRIIDTFTDEHPATREAKRVFQPYYRLYSGAFVDVVYDHFLAADENEFPGNSLLDFSGHVYSVLEKHHSWLPERFARMFPYMKTQDWLYHYRSPSGAAQSFGGVVRRAAYLSDSAEATRLFEQHYQPLQEYYRQFWRDVKPFALRQFEIIRKQGNNM
jgi:acyl carrier protein phosphodiesterase